MNFQKLITHFKSDFGLKKQTLAKNCKQGLDIIRQLSVSMFPHNLTYSLFSSVVLSLIMT